MSDTMTVKTNNVPRYVIESWELTDAERAEFDYIDWAAIEAGTDSATFVRYKGWTYDLGEFLTTSTLPAFNPLRKWHGYQNDSFFSGIVVRYCDDYERVVVGTFFA